MRPASLTAQTPLAHRDLLGGADGGAVPASHTAGVSDPDRYEPLPSIGELPMWLWRKTSRGLRVAVAVVVVLCTAGGLVAARDIREDRRERDAAERSRRAAVREERARRLRAEVRPIARRSDSVERVGAPAAQRLVQRRGLVADASAGIVADARRRIRTGELDGEVKRAQCREYPRTAGGPPPEEDLGRPQARYTCVAVTSEFERNAASRGGVIGHPYRLRVDFRTGRYALCKATGVTGPERERIVVIPRACGG